MGLGATFQAHATDVPLGSVRGGLGLEFGAAFSMGEGITSRHRTVTPRPASGEGLGLRPRG